MELIIELLNMESTIDPVGVESTVEKLEAPVLTISKKWWLGYEILDSVNQVWITSKTTSAISSCDLWKMSTDKLAWAYYKWNNNVWEYQITKEINWVDKNKL